MPQAAACVKIGLMKLAVGIIALLLSLCVSAWAAGPTALVARANANVQRIELSWQPPAPEPETYFVERSASGGDFARVAIVESPASGCTETHDLTPGTSYTYRVKAWDGGKVSAASAVSAAVKSSDFRVFDSMLFLNKPNLAPAGLEPLFIAYEDRFFRAATQEERKVSDADPIMTAEVAREAARRGKMMVIDIECWPSNLAQDGKAAVDQTLRRMLQVVAWSKAASPGLKIGYYGFPRQAYHASIGDRGRVAAAARDNMHAMLPLYEAVDLVFPSLYAFGSEAELWIGCAQDTVTIAREAGKPVYPFLMMSYHNQAPKEIANQLVPEDLWRTKLETLRPITDGVVIWGGYKTQWRQGAPWWQVTQRFVAQMQEHQSAAATQPLPN